MAKASGWDKMYYAFGRWGWLFCWLCWLCLPQPLYAQSTTTPLVAFDDSAPDAMHLQNDHYTLRIGKSNGAILGLTAANSDQSLMLGSRDGCLWALVLDRPNDGWRTSCDYTAEAQTFTYRWDAVTTSLVMTYTKPTEMERIDAVATFHTTAAAFFDLTLSLTNHTPVAIRDVRLPSDLLFEEALVNAAYLPFLSPGVRLKPSFFTENRTLLAVYPSDSAFADYLALNLAGNHLAIYTVNPPPAPVQPVELGFSAQDLPDAHSFFLRHNLFTWITPDSTWHSPVIRVSVGEPLTTTLDAYRSANGIAAYPTLADKLGARLSQFLSAPLIKADLHHIGKPFIEMIPDLVRLPAPVLLQPVAFQPRGHDEQGPDYLPPDPRWGTTADFQTLVTAAHQQGLLVMPYTNPTWWDDESPTLQGLAPLTIGDIAAQETPGQPDFESYGGRNGYTMSPAHPFVQQRLEQLMAQWQTAVGVDCIFDDQIGARPWQYDFNPASPTPLSYSDGWLDYTQTYADHCLMTEGGWDRLAANEIGFHGSLLTWARTTEGVEQRLGTDNWVPYPLASWLYGDKVLFYQHNLVGETMTTDVGMLAWNLAYGYMLSYSWNNPEYDPLNNPWLALVGHLQQTVGVHTAGRRMTAYYEHTPAVTESIFGDMSVSVNWSPFLIYDVDGHHVAPGGFYAHTANHSLVAGLFSSRFNNNPLSAGEHFLILERTAHRVTIRQPFGEQTVLMIDAPTAWQPGDPLKLWAFGQRGRLLGEVELGVINDTRRIYFVYKPTWHGEPVEHYELVKTR